LRIAVLSLNPLDFDTRTRLICDAMLAAGWELDIIVPEGSRETVYGDARMHFLPNSVKPFRQRRFIEYNYIARKKILSLKPDLIYAVDLDTLWAAISAAKATNARVIFESREYYPGQLSVAGRFWVRLFWNVLQRLIIRKADFVLTVSHSIAELLANKYRLEMPAIVMNVPALSGKTKPVDLRREYGFTSKFILIFQGVLRPGQGGKRCLNAIAGLDDVSLLVVGDGPDRPALEEYAISLGLAKRVRFAGRVSPDKLPGYTAGADAGLLLIEPLALNSLYALPQKLFQYIAADTPPIVTDLPELSRIVLTDKLGLVLDKDVDSEDADRINSFLNNRLESARQSCRRAAAKYNWEIEGRKILDICRQLTDD